MSISYQRQVGLPNFQVPEAVTVVGTGAIGSWVAYLAALSGVKRLVLYALGTVKETDIARLPFPPSMVGKAYGYALTSLIYGVRPGISIDLNGEFRPGVDRLEGTVFNCAASNEADFDIRLYQECVSRGLKYISGGYDVHSVTVATEVKAGDPQPSLEPVPVWAGGAAFAATAFLYAGVLDVQQPPFRTIDMRAGDIRFAGIDRPGR